MGFENPNNYTPEQIEEMEKMRERVAKLKPTDTTYQDSIEDLAYAEDAHRKVLKSKGILDKEILNELGDIHSTVVLEKKEAEKKTWIDSLTGLRNREALRREVPKLLRLEKYEPGDLERRSEKSQENQRPVDCSIVMLDFDNFSNVNAEYGFLGGNDVLKSIARIVEENIRKSDFLYRAGGEEFVIFLPNANAETATQVAEKIRKSVEDAVITVIDNKGDKNKLKRTISLGCIGTDQLPEWKESWGRREDLKGKASETEPPELKLYKKMLSLADAAVKYSKKNGRNQVRLYELGDEEIRSK